MKKAFLLAFALLFTPLVTQAASSTPTPTQKPASAATEKYPQGMYYEVVNDGPATTTPTITEFFSFYCGHCYNFSKNVAPELKKNLPKGVKFDQAHVDFIGREMGEVMSRAYATAQQLDVIDKIEPAIFSAIHEKRQNFTGKNDIRQLFIANGVSGKDFDKAWNSFVVNSQVANMHRETENAKIQGVPALLVNGKYLVKTDHLKSYDEMLDVAYYLTQKK